MFDPIRIKQLAQPYGLDTAAVLSVAEVESGGRSGFQPNGELTVLFEAHLFYRELKNAGLNPDLLMAKYPNLISPVWNRTLYKGGNAENERLKAALVIHPCAARCASYGMFQILGSNYALCGFPNVETFVASLATGSEAHIKAFLTFVSAQPAMLTALRIHDWPTFARLYNGPGYAANSYDTKIAAAFARFTSTLSYEFIYMADLATLKPKVRQLAEQLVMRCKEQGITVIVTQALRTFAEQDALFAQGRTKPGSIVTRAKGGFSLHNYGVAFDIVPIINGKADYKNLELFDRIGTLGEQIGLEWGGRWKTFPDRPHFQFLAGYTLVDFQNKKIDETKFALKPPTPPVTAQPIAPAQPQPLPTQPPTRVLRVTASVLNVRSAPSVASNILGQLQQGSPVTSLEQKNGWVKITFGTGFGWVSGQYVA